MYKSIYMNGQRERERERFKYMCIHTYTSVYMFIHRYIRL